MSVYGVIGRWIKSSHWTQWAISRSSQCSMTGLVYNGWYVLSVCEIVYPYIGNVLFNGALNTFYLQLYGAGHMVKDYSARKEACSHHYIGYSFWLAARVLLYAPSHRQDSTYTTAFVTPVMEHWLEKEIAQLVHHKGSIQQPIAPWVDTVPRSYISLIFILALGLERWEKNPNINPDQTVRCC